MTAPTRATKPAALLDWIRASAALLVVLGHTRALFFNSFEESEAKTVASKALHLLFGFGHQAVVVFFVMSGFFVGSSVIRQMSDGRWSWKNYLTARLSRLYIVLIPAIVLGWIIDWIGIHFLKAPIYAGGAGHGGVIAGSVTDQLNPITFLGNLAFLQTARVQTFGSNSPLWSLAYEFWYYMAFPLILGTLVLKQSLIQKIGAILAVVVIGVLVGPTICVYFALWLLGALLGYVQPSKAGSNLVFRWFSFLLALSCLVAARLRIFPSEVLGDFIAAIACSTALYAILCADRSPVGNLGKVGEFAAGFSYTLYLVHVPLLVFLCGVILKGDKLIDLSLSTLPMLLGLVILAVLYSVGLWFLFERNTEKVRKAISQSIKARTLKS